MIGPTEQLARIVPALDRLVDGIAVDQLYDATPCERFTVHDVIDHMIVGGGRSAARLRRQRAGDLNAPPVYGRVPAPEFRAAMEQLAEAVGSAETTLDDDLSTDTVARFAVFEALVHGWDIAAATGQSYEVDAEAVDAISAFVHHVLTDDLRDGDTFKARVPAPADARPLEQLVAFSGRQL